MTADGFRGTLTNNLGALHAAGRRVQDLLPSFLARRRHKAHSLQHLRPTAYLDGIRGFAALLVYFLHHSGEAHGDYTSRDRLESAFGANGEYYLGAFPGLRLFFSGGHFAVSVFFIVSGYVLSTKALKLIHADEHARLAETLASSLFRRWMRLYLPVFLFTLMPVLLWQFAGIKYSVIGRNFHPDFYAELWNWWCDVRDYTFVFGGQDLQYIDYHLHVWSLPYEMRGSVLVFATLLAFSTCTRNARIICSLALIFYLLYLVDGSLYAMFLAGMLLCDLDLLAADHHLPDFIVQLEPYKDNIYPVMFFISLYLAGIPTNSQELGNLQRSPGWQFISRFTPDSAGDPKWFFLFFAAILMVASISRIPRLKAFFEGSFCQYLGRISFMFYLVHGPILWTLGIRLYVAVGTPVGSRATVDVYRPWQNALQLPGFGFFGMEFNYLVVMLLLLPLTLWVGELATRAIDDRVLKFVAALHKTTLPSGASPSAKSPVVMA